MSRIFDETSFHFSPVLKKHLIAIGRLSEINNNNDYPDADLVRFCVENRLDLPSIRRTLLQLNLSSELTGRILADGLGALPSIDQACWDAFQRADVAIVNGVLPFAGPFLGIGWGIAIHEPQSRRSARWVSDTQAASIFIRVPAASTREIRLTVHHTHPPEMLTQIGIEVCGKRLHTRRLRDQIGRVLISAVVPSDVTQAFDGRLWIKVGQLNGNQIKGHFSLMHLAVCEPGAELAEFDSWEKDRLIAEQQQQLTQQLAEFEQQLNCIYRSRSWRLTAPFRTGKLWLRQHFRI